MKRFHDENDKLYQEYITSDLAQARKALEKMAEHTSAEIRVSGPAIGVDFGLYHVLFIDYARLYALEKRAGNEDMAEAWLIKARYWLLLKLEQAGTMSIQDRMDGFRRVGDADHLLHAVTVLDTGADGEGKGPKYLQEIDSMRAANSNNVAPSR